jgi:hypothetical protein
VRSGFVSVALLATVAACGGESSAEPLEEEGDLSAGRYETSAFEPTVGLELPAGWASLHEDEAFFDVHRPLSEPAPGGPVWDVAVLVARLEGDDAPGDVIDGLEGNPALELSAEAAAVLDGAEGIRVDVEAESDSTILSFPGGSLAAFPGRKVRVYAVDVDGQTVVLAVDAAADSFDADVEAARPVLDSVDFG